MVPSASRFGPLRIRRVLLLLLFTLVGARASARSDLEVVVPWDEARVEALRAWWIERGLPEAEVRGVPHRGLSTTPWGGRLVFLAYRQTELESLESEGRLAEPPEGEAVASFAMETWAPLRHPLGPPLRTWRDLGKLDRAGQLALRFPASDSAEGLVLGQVAALHELRGAELDGLLDPRREAGTFLAVELDDAALLRSLPEDSMTIGPLRLLHEGATAELDREAVLPEEGWIRLPLAFAFGSAVEPELIARVSSALLHGEGPAELARRCGLEPLDPDVERPEWMREAWQNGRPLWMDEAVEQRRELARRALRGSAEPDEDPTLWFDVLVLLAVLVGVLLAIGRSLRQWRERRREARARSGR